MEKLTACNNLELAIKRYAHQVQSMAFVYLKNTHDAEDVAQDVFIAYLQKAPWFYDAKKEKAWLLQVTSNRAKDLLRAKHRQEVPLTEDLFYLPKEESVVLHSVLNLEEKYRIPVHLHYYEGYSLAQIAKLMHVRPGTVASWLSRAREKLRIELEDDYFEI